MIKKIIACALSAAVILCLASCAKKPSDVSSKNSSSPVSSQPSSSETSSGTGENEAESIIDNTVIKNSFLSVDETGAFFYCGSSGGIYKQLADLKGISRIYSSIGYEFFSVNVLDSTKICVGYKSNKFDSDYIIFNLENKTVANAVSSPEFVNKNIYSLLNYNGAVYFLADPDRYGRYTLYCEKDAQVSEIASGVNEFFIRGDKLIYNVGTVIYSYDLSEKAEPLEPVWVINGGYLTGFSMVNNLLLYSTENETVSVRFLNGSYTYLPQNLNVWTSCSNESHAFICGKDGGIYALSFNSGLVSKVSDYTASSLFYHNGYLYLNPADAKDYPELDKSLIVTDGIYRFAVSDLLKIFDDSFKTESSLPAVSGTSSSLSSSDAEEPEILKPEKFGR